MDGKAVVAVAAIFCGTVVTSVVIYAWTRWLVRPRQTLPSADYDLRLRRIEDAVEAVAIEVERIGEGQRFTTRLLGERAHIDPSAIRGAAEHRPVVTPH